MGAGVVVDVTRAQAQINYELDHTCDRPREGVHNAPVAPESGESVRFPIGYVADSYLHERQSAHSGESLAWLEKLRIQRPELCCCDDPSEASRSGSNQVDRPRQPLQPGRFSVKSVDEPDLPIGMLLE